MHASVAGLTVEVAAAPVGVTLIGVDNICDVPLVKVAKFHITPLGVDYSACHARPPINRPHRALKLLRLRTVNP